MASDNLKQLGKHLRETREDVDFVLGRKLPFRVTVERIREVFTTDLPVEMAFTTKTDTQGVRVDIRFLKPPSPEAINAVYQGFCETFTTTNTAPAIFTLLYEFESGSVHVYVNGTIYDPAKWYEYSVNQIYISGGTHTLTNTIDICYEVTA